MIKRQDGTHRYRAAHRWHGSPGFFSTSEGFHISSSCSSSSLLSVTMFLQPPPPHTHIFSGPTCAFLSNFNMVFQQPLLSPPVLLVPPLPFLLYSLPLPFVWETARQHVLYYHRLRCCLPLEAPESEPKPRNRSSGWWGCNRRWPLRAGGANGAVIGSGFQQHWAPAQKFLFPSAHKYHETRLARSSWAAPFGCFLCHFSPDLHSE